MAYLELLETKVLCHQSGFGHRGAKEEPLKESNELVFFFFGISGRQMTFAGFRVAFFFPSPSENMW